MLTLKGRKAVITGGSKGIGYATAEMFLQEGMQVAVICRNPKEITNVKIKAYKCDVSSVDEIRKTLKDIDEDLGGIDVLVNSAGILDVSAIGTLKEENWDKVIDINLKGTYFMIQEATKYLEKSKFPRIINVGSNAGRMGGFENGLAYTSSKGGVISLTYGAARRLAPKGITVNCVCPGTIETPMSKNNYDEETHKRLIARFPLGRLGKPEEVAAAICYFASEEASFTTGAILDVNGGMFMG